MTTSGIIMHALPFIVISLLCIASVTQAFSCCTKYTKQSIPSKYIISFYDQKSTEVCDIDAVVFRVIPKPCKYLEKVENICADPEQDWVKNHVKALKNSTNKSIKKKIQRMKNKCGRRTKKQRKMSNN
ncbi:C-C motif chemokine 20-like [Pelobates fuscus]|uniref:C-C motif chemokine 20-like n=1 Tax=Pelobates fuscus TaxID=191477 RepID=UPI002FE4961C